VVHARTDLRVDLTRLPAAVRIAVWDGAPPPPDRYLGEAPGHGLTLVRALSSGLGIAPSGSGKTVWVDLPATPGLPA
jgi:hypothetical protein